MTPVITFNQIPHADDHNYTIQSPIITPMTTIHLLGESAGSGKWLCGHLDTKTTSIVEVHLLGFIWLHWAMQGGSFLGQKPHFLGSIDFDTKLSCKIWGSRFEGEKRGVESDIWEKVWGFVNQFLTLAHIYIMEVWKDQKNTYMLI